MRTEGPKAGEGGADEVAAYLSLYGFEAVHDREWSEWRSLPEFDLRVQDHDKVSGHTYYHLEGALARPGEWHSPFLKWRIGRRLTQLREGLHDPVKKELGASYKDRFGDTPFAHQIPVPGTTARLDCWCQRLAKAVNDKAISPATFALTLRFLGVPGAPKDVASPLDEEKTAENNAVLGDMDCAGTDASATEDLDSIDGIEDLNPFTSDITGTSPTCIVDSLR